MLHQWEGLYGVGKSYNGGSIRYQWADLVQRGFGRDREPFPFLCSSVHPFSFFAMPGAVTGSLRCMTSIRLKNSKFLVHQHRQPGTGIRSLGCMAPKNSKKQQQKEIGVFQRKNKPNKKKQKKPTYGNHPPKPKRPPPPLFQSPPKWAFGTTLCHKNIKKHKKIATKRELLCCKEKTR